MKKKDAVPSVWSPDGGTSSIDLVSMKMTLEEYYKNFLIIFVVTSKILHNFDDKQTFTLVPKANSCFKLFAPPPFAQRKFQTLLQIGLNFSKFVKKILSYWHIEKWK